MFDLYIFTVAVHVNWTIVTVTLAVLVISVGVFCGHARVFTQTASPFGGYRPAALTGTDSEFNDAIHAGITPTTTSVENFQWRICGTIRCQQAGLKCFF